MLAGHAATALLAKRAAPAASLGTLVAAALLLDLGWPMAVLLRGAAVPPPAGSINLAMSGLELGSWPFSDGAVGVALWAVLAGSLYFGLRRRPRAARLVTLLVAGHWLLDRLSHEPLEARPWPSRGLSGPAGVFLEAALVVAGLAAYAAGTRARDGVGRVGLWALGGCLAVGLVAGALDGDGDRQVAVLALANWLLVPAAAWVDRHRQPRPPPAPVERAAVAA